MLSMIKKRGPELLLEAFFIVFAVLVALAVEEWNDGRELRAQADMARAAVLSELEGNRAELMVGKDSTLAMLDRATDVVRRLRQGEDVVEVNISGVLPDFSDAAWETARVTGTVARMDYVWVLETARVYQTQALTLDLQRELLSMIGSLAVRAADLERFTEFRGQLVILTILHDELDRKYDSLMAHSEDWGPD